MHSHVKTYNGSEDLEDHLKIFQAAAKTKRWVMPTWCHMFNSTLTENARVWFDDLPPESIDSYNDLKEAFLKNYLQQKKCIRDPIVLHNIKQRNGESTKDFVQRRDDATSHIFPSRVRGGFKSGKEKGPSGLETPGRGSQAGFQKRGGFRSQHMQERRPDRFTLLTKTPKEILALEKGKFKTPPSMTTPVKKRNANKFCEFHGEVGHNTDECNHLRRQIEDMLKAGKLSHIIKELKQNSEKDQ
ncbi:reverse transcriptase domain-containing protein [Tanacetum coccineum]